jgi:hypothetical protein
MAYCYDTLRGYAGSSFIDDDSEVKWTRLNLESAYGVNVAYNNIIEYYGVGDGETVVLGVRYYKTNGTVVADRSFRCRTFWAGNQYTGSWSYNDWVPGYAQTAWFGYP